MAMKYDFKANFDKIGKACRQLGDECEKMMNENNPFDAISKIAKDISDRKDQDVALEFTKHICTLLKNNGVSPMIDEYRQDIVNENSIEQKYGVAITGLDFTEHDKRFNDEIRQLNSELSDAQELHDEYYNKCIDLTNQIEKLKSELETKVNFETDRLVKLPFDPLETANMLINATYKRENCMTGIEYDKDIYSIDDLEQIAEHLLVYCKHNKESEQ